MEESGQREEERQETYEERQDNVGIKDAKGRVSYKECSVQQCHGLLKL